MHTHAHMTEPPLPSIPQHPRSGIERTNERDRVRHLYADSATALDSVGRTRGAPGVVAVPAPDFPQSGGARAAHAATSRDAKVGWRRAVVCRAKWTRAFRCDATRRVVAGRRHGCNGWPRPRSEFPAAVRASPSACVPGDDGSADGGSAQSAEAVRAAER